MAMQDYEGSISVLYNGSVLAEAISYQADHKANLRVRKTMHKGVAGFARGAQESSVTIEEATPVDGLEADFFAHMKAGTYVTVEAQIGGVTYIHEGKIESIGVNASVEGDDTTHRIEIMCGPADVV